MQFKSIYLSIKRKCTQEKFLTIMLEMKSWMPRGSVVIYLILIPRTFLSTAKITSSVYLCLIAAVSFSVATVHQRVVWFGESSGWQELLLQRNGNLEEQQQQQQQQQRRLIAATASTRAKCSGRHAEPYHAEEPWYAALPEHWMYV